MTPKPEKNNTYKKQIRKILTQFIFIWQLFLDPEQEVVVPLVQPHGSLIGLDLICKSLTILILDMLAQSLDIQTMAKQQHQKESGESR